MDFTKYKYIKEFKGESASEDAQSYLEVGWDLLFIGQTQNCSKEKSEIDIVYVVGWNKKETLPPAELEYVPL